MSNEASFCFSGCLHGLKSIWQHGPPLPQLLHVLMALCQLIAQQLMLAQLYRHNFINSGAWRCVEKEAIRRVAGARDEGRERRGAGKGRAGGTHARGFVPQGSRKRRRQEKTQVCLKTFKGGGRRLSSGKEQCRASRMTAVMNANHAGVARRPCRRPPCAPLLMNIFLVVLWASCRVYALRKGTLLPSRAQQMVFVPSSSRSGKVRSLEKPLRALASPETGRERSAGRREWHSRRPPMA